MDTIKVNGIKAKMIAHRGANCDSTLERENSIAAFENAGAKPFFGIETDIHITADGHYIICHDDNTGRVADADINVEKSTLAEISRVKLREVEGGKNGNMKLPEYAEYLEICRKSGKTAVCELKNVFPRKNILEVIEITKAAGMIDNIIFISFYPENMFILREELPNNPLQWLTMGIKDGYLDIMAHFHLDIDVYYKVLTKELVDKIHGMGMKVNAWTPDTPEEVALLDSWGVDFITSNSCM